MMDDTMNIWRLIFRPYEVSKLSHSIVEPETDGKERLKQAQREYAEAFEEFVRTREEWVKRK